MEKEKNKEIYLAGGCFWGVEKYLSLLPGVVSTETGYANGKTANPTYEEVCTQDTGHAETVKVVYNGTITNLTELLQSFFEVIDPTALNRQGPDIGTQYRTGIYYTDALDAGAIDSALQALQQQYDKPLAIEAKPLHNYYTAEAYHQAYLDKNPGGYCHISPVMFAKAKEKRKQ